MILRSFLLPLLGLLLCSSIHGQMVRNIDISTVSFEKPIKALFFKNNGKTQKIAVPKNTVSLPVSYSGTLGIIFFATEEDLGKGTPEYARVVLPKDSAHVMLKFGQTPAGETEEEKETDQGEEQAEKNPIPMVTAYPFDPADHKAGSYRFFNNTKETVDLKLGDQTQSIEPGGRAIIQSPDWLTETKTLDFSASTTKEDGKVVKLYSSMWGHRPERRYMVFIEISSDRFRPVGIFSCYDVP